MLTEEQLAICRKVYHKYLPSICDMGDIDIWGEILLAMDSLERGERVSSSIGRALEKIWKEDKEKNANS